MCAPPSSPRLCLPLPPRISVAVEQAEVDADGLDAILSLVRHTAARDAAVEAVQQKASAPPPAKRAKREAGQRPEGEDEGTFASEMRFLIPF